METIWFVIIGVLFTLFVTLDGFDFGAGIIYRFVAKTDAERRMVLNAIGPVWDGNEVWLIIAGGAIFFAFPVAYASAFSGFYLALILLLWLLMFRGLSMELRSQLTNPLWRNFWDTMLVIGSLGISAVLGAALGNLLRGVPLGEDGYFFEPLWTDFRLGPALGLLDWYTMLTAVFAVAVFTLHGANFIAFKTAGLVQLRARRIARAMGWQVALLSVIMAGATYVARPESLQNFLTFPLGIALPVLAFASIGAVLWFSNRHRDGAAFAASAASIVFLMLGAGFTIYPNVLIATTDANDLTIYNAATSPYALRIGLGWFAVGASFAALYTIFMYRSFRGKVTAPKEGEGY